MEDLKLDDEKIVPMALGVAPLPSTLLSRELGILGRWPWAQGRSRQAKRLALESSESGAAEIAEERLVTRDHETLNCKLASHTRSTFLMVFSPDKDLLASTHGDHNIYITDVKSGECLQTLKGHPRTPWCVAFHPAHSGLLASGCLGGHVRVWDLNGGSELWRTDNVIASLVFHPSERLLVIATLNELHFWDWSLPDPFCKVVTSSSKEKVRYVKFDSLGHHLITGIANHTRVPGRDASRHPHSSWDRNEPPLYMGVRRVGANADSNLPPTYGRYFSYRQPTLQTSDPRLISSQSQLSSPLANASSSPSASNGQASNASASSASQTLSDLAAAASNQLMAENAAAAAAAEAAAIAAAAAAAETSSVGMSPRNLARTASPLIRPSEDPLLSDHPYGIPTADRHSNRTPPMFESFRDEARQQLLDEEDERRFRVSRAHARYFPRRFSHSPESSFVEVGPGSSTEVFINPDRASRHSRFLTLRERRWRMRFQNGLRQQPSLGRFDDTRSPLRSLTPSNEFGPSNEGSDVSRPIDEWAISRRMSLQQHLQNRYQSNGSSGSEYENPRFTQMMDFLSRDSLMRDFGRQEAGATPPPPDNPNPGDVVTPTRPDNADNAQPDGQANMVETNALVTQQAPTNGSARPPTSVPGPHSDAGPSGPRNDHNYTLNAQAPAGSSEPTPSTSAVGEPGARANVNSHNLDIVLLNRHIDHMQRICRASLADCTVSRRRRQMIRLQSIKRMLEHLQRQIRSLRAASFEELSRQSRAAEGALDDINGMNNMIDDDSDDDEEEEAGGAIEGLDLDDRNYDERVGEGYHMRNLARSLPRTARALGRIQRMRNTVTPVRNQAVPNQPTASRSLVGASQGLSRVHNKLLSQMRATFRAMEMSPDLSQRGKSPLAEAKASQSQKIMEKTEKEAVVAASKPPTTFTSATGNNTRGELRAMSQRIERMLRQHRESGSESLTNPAVPGSSGTNPSRDDDDDGGINIPRPDMLPLDLRKRWRHMYDGTLSRTPDSLRYGNLVDSSESGSESDFDFRNGSMSRTRHSLFGTSTIRQGSAISPGASRRLFYRGSRYRLLDTQFNPASRSSSPSLSRRMALDSHPYVRLRDNMTTGSMASSDSMDGGPALVPANPDIDLNENDANRERLPPLREIIWRRLRRRNAQLTRLAHLDQQPAGSTDQQQYRARSPPPSGNIRGPREALSWMVDQMHLDQSSSSLDSPAAPPTPAVQQPPGPRPSESIRMNPDRQIRQRLVAVRRDHHVGAFLREHYFMGTTTSGNVLTHRIQAWDFTQGDIPDISDGLANLVVHEAKIHNDASVDVSEDGTLLVTLVPSNLPMTTVVGVYSLEPASRGRLYATYSLESSAVSVSLSPTSRHLLVGLAIRTAGRISLSPTDRNLMAQIFRLKMPWEHCGHRDPESPVDEQRGRLIHRRDLQQNEVGQTSLNCIRWIPVAGQGIVYATNTGLLKILR